MVDSNPSRTLSICVCTANRPDILLRCLEAISAGQTLPLEVIVSDDSTDPSANESICRNFSFVSYGLGPRRCLCANRNVAIKRCRGDYISLLDDDAIIGEDFVKYAIDLIQTPPEKVIITGHILEHGIILPVMNASFLGHFAQPPNGDFRSIHLNSNLFPRSAFEAAEFDEEITYGYEDIDLCANLLRQGYRIEFDPKLFNEHKPPKRAISRDHLAERARFYVSIKRYWMWEKKPLVLLAYLIVAPAHRCLSSIKHRNFAGIGATFVDLFNETRRVIRVRRAFLAK